MTPKKLTKKRKKLAKKSEKMAKNTEKKSPKKLNTTCTPSKRWRKNQTLPHEYQAGAGGRRVCFHCDEGGRKST